MEVEQIVRVSSSQGRKARGIVGAEECSKASQREAKGRRICGGIMRRFAEPAASRPKIPSKLEAKSGSAKAIS